MHHTGAASLETTGRVLHRVRWYDLVDPVVSPARRRLIELAAPARGEDVLDVGCGTGTLAIAIHRMASPCRVHGIDASPEMIELAKKKAAKVRADVDLRVALIEALPFSDGSFDLVTSSLMLHHLPDDLKRTGVAEIRRVLKPGGRFLAMDLAAGSHSPLGHLLSLFGRVRGVNTARELAAKLREAGFEKVEVPSTRQRMFALIRAS
jgi:demethylmenaquinone methyltransferase/2-methoxy-6-polyprenyl-1,4-benzoquinol methylase/phosphoethanolamine N-methyltransferase